METTGRCSPNTTPVCAAYPRNRYPCRRRLDLRSPIFWGSQIGSDLRMTGVVGPVRGCAMPEDVLDVHPGSMLGQQSDDGVMARQRCLVERRRVRVRSLRIETIRVLSQVEQQLDDGNVTELGRPGEGEMSVLR